MHDIVDNIFVHCGHGLTDMLDLICSTCLEQKSFQFFEVVFEINIDERGVVYLDYLLSYKFLCCGSHSFEV